MGNNVEKSKMVKALTEAGITDSVYLKVQLLIAHGVTTRDNLMRVSLETLFRSGFSPNERFLILMWLTNRNISTDDAHFIPAF